MTKIEKLRNALNKINESFNKAEVNIDSSDLRIYEFADVADYQYKKCVEAVLNESYDDVCGYDIYEAITDGTSKEDVVEEILKSINIAEGIEKCEVMGCKVEKGHTLEEYREKFGELYDAGELWDFTEDDFENGAIEPDADTVYWLIKDEDGELRYFETMDEDEAKSHLAWLKDDKKEESLNLKEGTSNFPTRFDHDFPLLVFYTYDEFLDMMKYDSDYPEEADYEVEDEKGHFYIDYDKLEDARDAFADKYFSEAKAAVLDEDELERLQEKVYDFSVDHEKIELGLGNGYYEAHYIDYDELEDLTDEEVKEVLDFAKALKDEFGLTEYKLAYVPASNGETGFKKVEDLHEDDSDDLGLPKEVEVSVSELDFDGDFIDLSDDEVSDLLGDYLSDKYGYCHFGFNYKGKEDDADKIICYDIKWDTTESKKKDKKDGALISMTKDPEKSADALNHALDVGDIVCEGVTANDFMYKVIDIIENYIENLENEGDDTFAGTEDSYANEMLSQDLWDAVDSLDVSNEKKDEIYNKYLNASMKDPKALSGYLTIRFGKKQESLKEEDGVAREEYCVIVNGNNEDCYDSEEEAIKYARKRFAEEGNDSKVKVLLVKYGPKNEHGDESELGIETIWASHFDESLKEDLIKYKYITDPHNLEGEVEAKDKEEAIKKVETILAEKGIVVSDEIINIDESLKEAKKKKMSYEDALEKLYSGDWDNERFNDAILDGEVEMPKDESLKPEKFKRCGENLAEKEYKDYEGWKDEDIKTHKDTDWKARNYDDLDVGDEYKDKVYIYRWDADEVEVKDDVTFHKFLRANPIYSPYYGPVDYRPDDVVGPMYDGRMHNDYLVMDRYEDQKTYDLLSSSYKKEDDKKEPLKENEEHDLSDDIKETLDDYGILYGDVVDYDDKINIVGVDEEEWEEVRDALEAELKLEVQLPPADHEEFDDEIVVIKK